MILCLCIQLLARSVWAQRTSQTVDLRIGWGLLSSRPEIRPAFLTWRAATLLSLRWGEKVIFRIGRGKLVLLVSSRMLLYSYHSRCFDCCIMLLVSFRLSVAACSSSLMKNFVQATHLTPSVGRRWCPASCRTLSSPIGTPSWWDRTVLPPALDPIVSPWCPASCRLKPPARLSWEALLARSERLLCCQCLKPHLRSVCITEHNRTWYLI